MRRSPLPPRKPFCAPWARNPDPQLAAMEEELLTRVNNLGIGPQGLGGRIMALAVNVEMIPCDIASFPMAVNLNCHAHRHQEAVI